MKDTKQLVDDFVNEMVEKKWFDKLTLASFKDWVSEKEKYEFDDWNTNGKTSELAKVLIAPENYTEGDKKYFTWKEACAIEKKLNNGWRLPTRQEWTLICEEFGKKGGVYDVETLMKSLALEKNGVLYSEENVPSYAGRYGYYWSSTSISNGVDAYSLFFSGTSYINPSYNPYRYSGLSVRLVKEVKDE